MTDIKDLWAKSQEYIELGKKATQNVIEIIDADDVAEPIAIRHYGQVTNRKIYESDAKFYPELFKEGYQIQYTPPTDEDWDLWKNAQSMSAHIAELQKRLDDYEERVEKLIDLSKIKIVQKPYALAILRAVEIMTGECEG